MSRLYFALLIFTLVSLVFSIPLATDNSDFSLNNLYESPITHESSLSVNDANTPKDEALDSTTQANTEALDNTAPTTNKVLNSTAPSTNDKIAPAANNVLNSTTRSTNEALNHYAAPTTNEISNSTAPSSNEALENTAPATNEVLNSTAPSSNETLSNTVPAINEAIYNGAPSTNKALNATSSATEGTTVEFVESSETAGDTETAYDESGLVNNPFLRYNIEQLVSTSDLFGIRDDIHKKVKVLMLPKGKAFHIVYKVFVFPKDKKDNPKVYTLIVIPGKKKGSQREVKFIVIPKDNPGAWKEYNVVVPYKH
ncbi:3618_t:CDS:1 [Acaulospora morrowiae]|uniref:3618_t:CDS:1 n=1 Tax=Acaulospora morrowiae TaxID=94023 RepID=A0A9N8YWU7_9GLOM|nr:3618_t:CDS:1 [Acaulospora morrowiae]